MIKKKKLCYLLESLEKDNRQYAKIFRCRGKSCDGGIKICIGSYKIGKQIHNCISVERSNKPIEYFIDNAPSGFFF